MVTLAVLLAWAASVALSGCGSQSESPEQIEKRAKQQKEQWEKQKGAKGNSAANK
jgi:hypothetical protein